MVNGDNVSFVPTGADDANAARYAAQSQIMKTVGEGFQRCYNAQVAVDGERQVVVATKLTANGSDQGEMLALLDEVEATFKKRPDMVLADAGDSNERDLKELEARGIKGYVASGREGKKGRRLILRSIRRHIAWPRSRPRQPAGRCIKRASGCPRRRTGGSSMCWDCAVSVCVGRGKHKGSGTSRSVLPGAGV